MAHPSSSPRPLPPRASDWLRLVIPLVVVAAFMVAAWKLGYFNLKDPQKLDRAAEKAEHTPWLGPVFAIVYAGVAMLAAPVGPMAYLAGAMFGLVQGSIWVWLGSLGGAAGAYSLAHTGWGESVRRLLSRYDEKLRALRRGRTFLTVLRLQLMPIIPFGVFNYAVGLARLPFAPFLGATALGIVPGTIAAVYVGEQVAAGFRGGGTHAFVIAAAVMAGLLVLSFVPNIVSRARGRSAKYVAPPPGDATSASASNQPATIRS